MNKKKKIFVVLLSTVVLVIVGGIVTYSIINSRLEKLADQQINTPNLSEVADGTYIGEASVFPVSVRVEVTVEDHTIKSVELLKHTNGQGKEAEEIVDTVIEKQQLEVDVISEATYSSKVILLAIEDALTP